MEWHSTGGCPRGRVTGGLIVTLAMGFLMQAAAWGVIKNASPEGTVRFDVVDHLHHPFFWWPRTLLSYPVRFEAAKVKPEELALLRLESGEREPFQLSEIKSENGRLLSATVNFFCDLPSGAQRHFELTPRPPVSARMATEPHVAETQEKDSIVLDSGAVKVRLPASQAGGPQTPGPIMQMSRGGETGGDVRGDMRGRGGGWMGSSSIVSPRRALIQLVTECIESGPLFITYRLTYSFAGDARYVARVRVISGCDHIEFYEEMQNFPREEQAYVNLRWEGFKPTHREAPNHPLPEAGKEPGYKRYPWEKIDQQLISTQHGASRGMTPEGELPFRLGAYQPWGAFVQLTWANFWDERSNDAVGLFIDKVAAWQDYEYALWSASTTLQVRYFYQDGLLSWRWPLVTGTRSAGIVCYDHQKDIKVFNELEALSKPGVKDEAGREYKARLSPASYLLFLQNRYGTLDLNMVKDWVLEYPDTARHQKVLFPVPQPVKKAEEPVKKTGDPEADREAEEAAARKKANEAPLTTAAMLEDRLYRSDLICDLPIQGTRQNAGFSPVYSRSVYGLWVDAYDRLYPTMDAGQRERLTAMYLLLAYTHGEEDYMPMKTMLAGHPNFLSDVKSAPALIAFLFPDHPMAREWADEFERFVDLNARYHTRPDIPAWQSAGGRWTENLGTYVWAALRPEMHGAYALREYVDGRNRLANPQVAQIGDWLVNALTAPFNGEDPKLYITPDGKRIEHSWGVVLPPEGPRRVHPPQGAHSGRRIPPRSMWLLGEFLQRFAPLTAEHLMWAARPTDDDVEQPRDVPGPWDIMFPKADNRGTNPHLKSSKYTGYGITLRAATDTPGETSLHIQQIDDGPNYRWGNVAEGGCGALYYYAAGKAYSHNDREDVGDRACQDTDFCCNFGVWKDGRYKAIGRNVLERPMYDLGSAQFAELLPKQGASAYSWPEYQGRRILMVGDDYFLSYDAVFSNAIHYRFSWFVHRSDEMPFIQAVKGKGMLPGSEATKTELTCAMTRGVWYDGSGDCMMLISHKPGLKVDNRAYGCSVTSSAGTDRVFFSPSRIRQSDKETQFDGTAGVVRRLSGGGVELAIFHGASIGAGGVTLSVSDPDLGVSARFKDAAELSGICASQSGGTLSLQWPAPATGGEGAAFFLDGQKQKITREGGAVRVVLPAGRHLWQWTSKLPVPLPPAILRTENHAGGGRVFCAPSAGASRYRVEMSRDNGQTWQLLGSTAQMSYDVTGLPAGIKVHLRVIAENEQNSSSPADEYPLYVSDRPPLPPDGLRLSLEKGKVSLSWGQVLGVHEYQLYRRARGQEKFEPIWRGAERQYVDPRPGVIPAFAMPGAAANAQYQGPAYTIYEYAVAAVDGNGEGEMCRPVDTDPASWLNWDPRPGEGFRRRLTYNTIPFAPEDQTPLRYSPAEPSGR